MSKPDRVTNPTPAEKVMPQFSKTAAETRDGDPAAPAEPDDGQVVPRNPKVSPGDAPIGQSGNDGSSPYEEPNQRAKKQRSS